MGVCAGVCVGVCARVCARACLFLNRAPSAGRSAAESAMSVCFHDKYEGESDCV